jgi:hypothetical protein
MLNSDPTTCRLCLQEAVLRHSHIIPELLHKPLYSHDHKFMAISGVGTKGWKPFQKGERDRLLCDECERLLNDRFEKPFVNYWATASSQLRRISPNGHRKIRVPYTEFKLLHLSILFRASVSSLPTFRNVQLGPHEEKIRQMLLANDPGPTIEYPIVGDAVLDDQCNPEERFVSVPFRTRYGSHSVYCQVFAGAVWYISISSHRNRDFLSRTIDQSGTLDLNAVPLRDLPQAQLAATLVRQKYL